MKGKFVDMNAPARPLLSRVAERHMRIVTTVSRFRIGIVKAKNRQTGADRAPDEHRGEGWRNRRRRRSVL
jgi:hypothetical protein